MFGAGGGTSSYKEVEETDLLILWGSNARETHPIFFHHVLKAVHNGAKLYVLDPRRTALSTWWKKMGCVSRALLPQRKMTSVSSASW